VAKVLIIEDDIGLAAALSEFLESEGHRAEVFYNGQEGLDTLKFSGFDLALIDWQLPGMCGPDICREYRKYGGKTPILMLTQKSKIDDKEQGLDAGADDYLPKPFEIRELGARVRALLRRSAAYHSSSLDTGKISLDYGRQTVTVEDRTVQLMAREFSVLEFLLRHRNNFVPSDRLITHVWESDTEVGNEALRVCINRIRKKVDVEGRTSVINSSKGQGYRISEEYLP
jgi:DNA-binding response OmpR family regulator